MKSNSLLLLTLALPLCAAVAADGGKVFNVRDTGAKGDGKTLDTAAIQQALDNCGKAGGGTVRIPPGDYHSKPIHLRSKTTLQLDTGATLLATDERGDFENPAKPGFFVAFINGKDLTDIAITGKGTIDGSGERWWGPAREAKRNPTNAGFTLPRPRMIVLSGCKNVRVEGVTLQNSPSFHLVPTECDDVVIEGVTIRAPDDSPNTDAIDPSVSRRVRITKCLLDVGDDNVAIKSGKRLPGREFACEDITVTDCTFLHGHGMSIGSETAGSVRNVTVERLTLIGTENGLRIKSSRSRGGLVENVLYRDIKMTNVTSAFTVVSYYPKVPKTDAAKPMTPETPAFRNLRFENITATCSKEAGSFVGLPESLLDNVVLENVRVTAQTGLTIRNAKGFRLRNVEIKTESGPAYLTQAARVEGLKPKSE